MRDGIEHEQRVCGRGDLSFLLTSEPIILLATTILPSKYLELAIGLQLTNYPSTHNRSSTMETGSSSYVLRYRYISQTTVRQRQ